jgi:hypothetical protein
MIILDFLFSTASMENDKDLILASKMSMTQNLSFCRMKMISLLLIGKWLEHFQLGQMMQVFGA